MLDLVAFSKVPFQFTNNPPPSSPFRRKQGSMSHTSDTICVGHKTFISRSAPRSTRPSSSAWSKDRAQIPGHSPAQSCCGIRGGKEKTNNPLGQGPCLFPPPFPVLFTKDQKPTCKSASRNERITIGKNCKKINHTNVWWITQQATMFLWRSASSQEMTILQLKQQAAKCI